MISIEKYRAGMERQLERFHAARAAGMPRRGWKIAINVPEVLTHLDLPHSALGWLDGNRVLNSGDAFNAPPGAKLLIEPEVAIHVSETIAPGSGLDAARRCISGLSPALEIVNMADPGKDFEDVVASGMFHCASVLGPMQALDRGQELGRAWPLLEVDGVKAEALRPELVPDDLAELVLFVADFLSEFGEALETGDLILSGSYVAKAPPIAPGQTAFADHGPLGSVSVSIIE